MEKKLKYFLLNNAYDFGRGFAENMSVDGDALRFSSDKLSGIGKYLGRVFDSGNRGTVWHRLLVRTENCASNELRFTVFASDSQDFIYKGKAYTIDGVFHDTGISLSEKIRMFSLFEKKRINGETDTLLHDVAGRYLWVYAEVFSTADKPAAIKDLWVYLPAESWIDRLPRIYRSSEKENGFLERYLGIFQTLYEEIENEIDRIADRFDPESAESGFLQWLAEWLDISDCSVWEEEKLRKLLLSALRLYRSRGTKESVSEVVELYTGEKPFIVENFQLLQQTGEPVDDRAQTSMYGNDPYKVFVLVRSDVIKSNADKDALWRIIRGMMPLTVNFELKILEPYVFLDQYSYLGVNSNLGQPENAVLDGKSRITFSVLGEA